VAVDRLLAEMERHAGGAAETAHWIRTIGLPLTRGFVAFARGHHAAAVEALHPVRFVAHNFGGSHAQRDVIDWTLTEAAVRAKLPGVAQALAHERAALKPHSVVNRDFVRRALAQ
jgi:hypothetical protein